MALRRDRMSKILSSLAVSRVLYIRNLPTNITSEDMQNNFGKFGEIELIKIENVNASDNVEYEDKRDPKMAKKYCKNTNEMAASNASAYVTFEEKNDAKEACDNLSGSNVFGGKLNITYYQENQINKKMFSRNKNYRRYYYYYFQKKKEYL